MPPVGTMLLIVILWFGISAPLSAVGSYFGSKHGVGVSCFLSALVLNKISGGHAPGEGEPDPATNPPAAEVFATVGACRVCIYYAHVSADVRPRLPPSSPVFYRSVCVPATSSEGILTQLDDGFQARRSSSFTSYSRASSPRARTTPSASSRSPLPSSHSRPQRLRSSSRTSSSAPKTTGASAAAYPTRAPRPEAARALRADAAHRWHWRAFLIGGGSAFWLLAYGIIYWAMRLSLHSITSAVLYIGYLLLLALFDFLITGASCVLSVLLPLQPPVLVIHVFVRRRGGPPRDRTFKIKRHRHTGSTAAMQTRAWLFAARHRFFLPCAPLLNGRAPG